METQKTKQIGTITGVFLTKDNAEQAYDSLIRRGYSPEEITVLMSDKTRDRYFGDADDRDSLSHRDTDYDQADATERVSQRDTDYDKDRTTKTLGNKSMEKAGVGSAIGGTLGAIVGAIAAIGTSVALPGLGLIVAGPIVAALTGAGAGGLTGGLIGGLVGAGIPKEKAEVYEKSIKEGGIVVGVTPKSYEDRTTITDEWRTYRGEEIYGYEDKRSTN
jgi:hypothetical protein